MTWTTCKSVAGLLTENHYLGPISRGVAWQDNFGAIIIATPTARRIPGPPILIPREATQERSTAPVIGGGLRHGIGCDRRLRAMGHGLRVDKRRSRIGGFSRCGAMPRVQQSSAPKTRRSCANCRGRSTANPAASRSSNSFLRPVHWTSGFHAVRALCNPRRPLHFSESAVNTRCRAVCGNRISMTP
jgi:hypothetical protein